MWTDSAPSTLADGWRFRGLGVDFVVRTRRVLFEECSRWRFGEPVVAEASPFCVQSKELHFPNDERRPEPGRYLGS